MNKALKITLIVIGSIVLLLLIGSLVIYASVNKVMKNHYMDRYDTCMRINSNNDFSQNPDYEGCVSQGGCFNPCANVCDPDAPNIGYFEMNKRLNRLCHEGCVQKCFYPIEHFE